MASRVEELRRQLVADVNAGTPGSKLGSERELAERYSTSRSTLRQVLAALEEAGLVERVIGRAGGIFISHVQVQRSLTDVVGVPAFLASQGYVVLVVNPFYRSAKAADIVSSALTQLQIKRISQEMGIPEFAFFKDRAAAEAWVIT